MFFKKYFDRKLATSKKICIKARKARKRIDSSIHESRYNVLVIVQGRLGDIVITGDSLRMLLDYCHRNEKKCVLLINSDIRWIYDYICEGYDVVFYEFPFYSYKINELKNMIYDLQNMNFQEIYGFSTLMLSYYIIYALSIKRISGITWENTYKRLNHHERKILRGVLGKIHIVKNSEFMGNVYIEWFKKLGIDYRSKVMNVCSSVDEQSRESIVDRSYVVLAPYASNINKEISDKLLIDIIRYIISVCGLDIVITGGKGDEAKSAQLYKRLRRHNMPIERIANEVGKSNGNELVQILQNCQYAICCDSGTSHLAAALGKRCLVLMGMFNRSQFYPYSFNDPRSNRNPIIVYPKGNYPCENCQFENKRIRQMYCKFVQIRTKKCLCMNRLNLSDVTEYI